MVPMITLTRTQQTRSLAGCPAGMDDRTG